MRPHNPFASVSTFLIILACAVTSVSAAGSIDLVERSSASKHRVVINGRSVRYRATAGTLLLRSEVGKPRAEMFYVAYEATPRGGAPVDRKRPVTFMFNGGPGSSSMWLHLGSFGPVRLTTPLPGMSGSPSLAPNQWSLLDKSDLVFLDAVGTGYSRVFDPADVKFYWGNDQDAASFTEAIARYLTVNRKWNAPKFLLGESYGTMRAAMIAPRLQAKGIDLSGIILMSTILNFGHFAPGLDQAAIDLLPSYAATAFYHKRIPDYPGGLEKLVRDARIFARGAYAQALAQGDRLPPAERAKITLQLQQFTGLSASYLGDADLRINIDQFRRELLRDRRRSVGSLDTRFTGDELGATGERSTYDPADAALTSPYTAAINSYLTGTLGFSVGQQYIVSDGRRIMGAWDWSHQPTEGDRQNSLADAVPDLAVAMRQQPSLRVLSLNGYYDLMTPFFGAEYDLNKLGRVAVDRVTFHYYESGHMLYIDDRVMPRLRADIARFYDQAALPAFADDISSKRQ